MEESFTSLIEFFKIAFYVVILNAAALSTAGIFLYQRRSLFLGAALPQIAGFGIVLASIFTQSQTIALLLGLSLCIFVLAWKPSNTSIHIENDAFIGAGFTISMAGSLLILAFNKNTESHGYEMLFKGGILASMENDFYLSLAICIPALVILTILRRRMLAVNLMPIQAQITGLNKHRFYEYLQFVCIAAIILVSLGNLGTMGTFSFLLFPIITILPFAKSASSLFYILPIYGIIMGITGLGISLKFDLPAGPAIVGVLFIAWIISKIIEKITR